jgi:MOSC domain-containing protein YiiM
MKLISINLGQERTLQRKTHTEQTGIFKFPVTGSVQLSKLGLPGDVIISTEHHGGVDQAVYVYGEDDYQWWGKELGKELAPGTFGENLTISQLESADFNIGDLLHIGDVVLQVTSPRVPCGTFAARMEDPQWVKRFRYAERPGFYCRVMKEGALSADMSVKVEKYNGETISVVDAYRYHYDAEKTAETTQKILRTPIAERWQKSLNKKLAAG